MTDHGNESPVLIQAPRAGRPAGSRRRRPSPWPGVLLGAVAALAVGYYIYQQQMKQAELFRHIQTLTNSDATPADVKEALQGINAAAARRMPFGQDSATMAEIAQYRSIVHDMIVMTNPYVTEAEIAEILNRYWPGEGDFFLAQKAEIERRMNEQLSGIPAPNTKKQNDRQVKAPDPPQAPPAAEQDDDIDYDWKLSPPSNKKPSSDSKDAIDKALEKSKRRKKRDDS